ncbi:PLP-dependent aminotransferase family protein [Zavarzinia compransoris]|uniref:PLP-dependent aminotransferase family protein n=1 Tax=Zavarzinia compransoris TaxID=1264899 RepID=A0A317EDY1_9PROT|nr:PLP-dependent aminotransferase family protein [Zavarzinia compransoris]PWR23425.1 PLP-dependent aminotransferase family protein [Zavarzinia compransoris]TDP45999.1 GntR family transcriptional regulator/MocR family aminotransferase [Zavarzinia compransoris]
MYDDMAAALDRGQGLTRQLYEAFRRAILTGRLGPGERLPASRDLAGRLAVGRNTVTAVFERLAAEGFIEARGAAGTRVARLDPALLQRVQPVPGGRLSERGRRLAAIERGSPSSGAFVPGLPALDLFPAETWARLLGRRLRQGSAALLGFEHAAGWPPLKEAIARQIAASRGIVVEPERILVTTGAQGALAFLAQLLCDPGDPAWIEDPGYLGARGALVGAGLALVPVPVDGEGLDVAAGLSRAAAPRLIYVTPSHQYPTGVVLSLQRRLALLQAAEAADAWVIEDDYDSEFQFAGPPLAPLHNLAPRGRVIHVGTFGKALAPALRLGYAVLPPALVGPASVAMRHGGQAPPLVVQAALADFMAEGHFAGHLRRLVDVYGERRARLVEACARHLGDYGALLPAEAGIQLAFRLHSRDDRAASAAAARAGIVAPALSRAALENRAITGLQFGFAAVPADQVEPAVIRLAAALRPGV